VKEQLSQSHTKMVKRVVDGRGTGDGFVNARMKKEQRSAGEFPSLRETGNSPMSSAGVPAFSRPPASISIITLRAACSYVSRHPRRSLCGPRCASPTFYSHSLRHVLLFTHGPSGVLLCVLGE
jgi:hypothetical protein